MSNTNKLIIISGVGFKTNKSFIEINDLFEDSQVFQNIGLATAKILVENNYNVLLISRTDSKLKTIKKSLEKINSRVNIHIHAIDLLNEKRVKNIFLNFPQYKSYDYIHSAGLSAGGYKIKNDNPYLNIEDLPVELPIKEFEVVIKSLLIIIKNILPKLKKQKESKVIVINSMSGIRPYAKGFSHSSAKGGLHNAIRSLSLELEKYNIYFTEINPGIVETGSYQTSEVIESVMEIASGFGHSYNNSLPKIKPSSVAKSVLFCIENEANILTINLVPKGQWKHQGA